eukprot:6055638-Pyramimonas_sp.AAC.1
MEEWGWSYVLWFRRTAGSKRDRDITTSTVDAGIPRFPPSLRQSLRIRRSHFQQKCHIYLCVHAALWMRRRGCRGDLFAS